MRYHIPGFLLVMIAGLLILRGAAADKSLADRPTGAVILVHDERGRIVATHRLTDAKQVESLEVFFPDYRERPASRSAGGWRIGYTVYFDSPDGHSARLSVSLPSKEAAVWSIGKGDLAVKGDFHKFVADLGSPTTTASKPRPGDWSEPAHGLTGRLHVVPEDLKPGLRHEVSVELKNKSTASLSVIDQPRLDVELTVGGKPVTEVSLPMSGPIPFPQWAVVPQSASVSFRVDMTTVGVPVDGSRLLAVGGKKWQLEPGTYELRATLVAEKRKDSPEKQWFGKLTLPPVEIVVAKPPLMSR